LPQPTNCRSSKAEVVSAMISVSEIDTSPQEKNQTMQTRSGQVVRPKQRNNLEYATVMPLTEKARSQLTNLKKMDVRYQSGGQDSQKHGNKITQDKTQAKFSAPQNINMINNLHQTQKSQMIKILLIILTWLVNCQD
jgi:hypothetical protein